MDRGAFTGDGLDGTAILLEMVWKFIFQERNPDFDQHNGMSEVRRQK
jgi:hypothetical protein